MLRRRLVNPPSPTVLLVSDTDPAGHFTNVLRAICVTTCDKMKDAWSTTPQQEGAAFFSVSVHGHTSSSTNIIPTFF